MGKRTFENNATRNTWQIDQRRSIKYHDFGDIAKIIANYETYYFEKDDTKTTQR